MYYILGLNRIIFLILLNVIVFTSCNYKVYYNSQFVSNIDHTIINSRFKVDSIIFLGSIDTIPEGAKFVKDVDLYSPLFWGEASFHSPFYMMLNLAKYESSKLDGNIIQIMSTEGYKSSRLRYSIKVYKLNEPDFSKYDNFLNPVNSFSIDSKLKKVHIKNFTQGNNYRIYSNDSIICSSENIVKNGNYIDLTLSQQDTIYLLQSKGLFINQKDVYDYTKEDIEFEKCHGTSLNNNNEFYFFVINIGGSFVLRNVQRYEYVFNSLNY